MPTLTRADLHDYQTRAVDAIKTKRRYMLALEMGLGKTSSTLTAVSDLLDEFLAHKVLVVAPLRVALSVWQDEIRTWDHLRHLSITSVLGTERQRLAALQRVTDIYTINRENLPWLVTHYGKKWPFDVIVIDESSSFKSASSQRFQSVEEGGARVSVHGFVDRHPGAQQPAGHLVADVPDRLWRHAGSDHVGIQATVF
jgi:SNF2 family DNA or RNA helicase